MSRSWALALLAAFLLAGCSTSGTKSELSEASFAPEAEVDANHGAIKGFVTNVEIEPVAGAQLLLRPGELTSITALDGGFTFSRLDPGTYTVFVSQLGFQAAQVTATVVAGEVAPLDLQLVELRIARPRAQVFGPNEGYFQCRWAGVGSGPCGYVGIGGVSTGAATDVLWTRDQVGMTFNLDGPDWHEIVFEARWTPSSAATNSKMSMLFSYDGRPGTHLFMKALPQASPLWTNFTEDGPKPGAQGDAPDKPMHNLTLRNWLAVGTSTSPDDPNPAAVAYEMRFQLVVTVFYNRVAPEGYSAWPN